MSTNIGNQKSSIYSPIGYKLNLKRAVVNSLKVVFNNNYPNVDLRNLFITLEWPDHPEQYPAMLVGYTETDLRNIGVGHLGFIDNNKLIKRWEYAGTVQVLIVAQTALMRDFISDHFVNMFAFNTLYEQMIPFLQYYNNNQGLQVTLLRDTLQPVGDRTVKGSTWGLDDFTMFTCGYSFGVVGSFTSVPNTYGYVSAVRDQHQIG